MKKFGIGAVFGLALTGMGFAGMAAADPVDGTWRTAPNDVGSYLYVAIGSCGKSVCGIIKAAYDKTGKRDPNNEFLGKKMIWDMNPDGQGFYSGGKIWAPDSKKTYKSKMVLSGSSLEVKGCVAGGMICRGQQWKRVN